MPHRHRDTSHHERTSKSRDWLRSHRDTLPDSSRQGTKPKLEFVLKCDSAGSVEAVTASLLKIAVPEVAVNIIHGGVGDINESDVLMAETGSRLIIGFQVGVLPGIDRELKGHAVEARLYEVIYSLTADIKSIAEGLIPPAVQDEVLGTAKVIALFKSSRKGTIIGCEIRDGYLALGKHFRIISAMGPVYSGVIGSMHIEKNAVQKAVPGQQVGIKINDFNKVRIGDLVESFTPASPKKARLWQPKGEVIRISQ